MSEENENVGLLEKYVKLRLGGATYRVRLMTLIFFAAAIVILIAAILILALSNACAPKEAGGTGATASPSASVSASATALPSATPEASSSPDPSVSPDASGSPATSASPAASGFTKTLEAGMTDDSVAAIQQKLVDLYYMVYPDTKDGKGVVTTYFGSITSKAVKMFQNRNGLPETGKCDSATYTKLMSSSATAYIMKQGDKLEMVSAIQKALIDKGYLKDKATGYCGDVTVAAVKAFQSANKLTADGIAGSATLKLLLGY